MGVRIRVVKRDRRSAVDDHYTVIAMIAYPFSHWNLRISRAYDNGVRRYLIKDKDISWSGILRPPCPSPRVESTVANFKEVVAPFGENVLSHFLPFYVD